jgi:hypothetical protein
MSLDLTVDFAGPIQRWAYKDCAKDVSSSFMSLLRWFKSASATKLILLKELGRTPQPSEFAIRRGESE